MDTIAILQGRKEGCTRVLAGKTQRDRDLRYILKADSNLLIDGWGNTKIKNCKLRAKPRFLAYATKWILLT